ncbi:MAG: T9SS type A sorting domain-containing protein [candidate division Zixibacteria bacterium]|nr:T9SS type A sorting domain-containing protein [candidate division Zixibacteria bacterium]
MPHRTLIRSLLGVLIGLLMWSGVIVHSNLVTAGEISGCELQPKDTLSPGLGQYLAVDGTPAGDDADVSWDNAIAPSIRGASVVSPVDGTATSPLMKPTPTVVMDDGLELLPSKSELGQNYPNPFNPRTSIQFYLPRPAQVGLDVFDILGRKVATLVNDWISIGIHTVIWDGQDDSNRAVASGAYFYRLHAGNRIQTRKMILLK